IEALNLPIRNVLAGVKPESFSCPGSILRTAVDPSHPVGFGMPAESVAVFQSNPAFDVVASFGPGQPRVVVKYPEAKLLLSGWLEGEPLLVNKAAVVDVPVQRGHVILFGFGVQQRAQPHATFKLLFNALYHAVTPTP
ncbi:MAG: peptidase M14 family protein, partial [Acidobacteria bacterium]|nr:peptidase M14 family protein [Acidobacteriota bacterium]